MVTPISEPGGFQIQDSSDAAAIAAAAGLAPELPTEIPGVGNLAFFKAEDAEYFAKILKEEDETQLTVEEMKERKIMRLLLKIKNGTPPVRKTALRQITDKAREFGAGPLFDKILPLLMERTLEDQERHLLVKVIDHVLYKLDDLVRPYVHKILVVIEPLLIDEDYYARVEGREIISNLSKAAGLAHMISTMRPDIDHADEYVRNTTARAFSVVASALGIPSLLPFLKIKRELEVSLALCQTQQVPSTTPTTTATFSTPAPPSGGLQMLVVCLGLYVCCVRRLTLRLTSSSPITALVPFVAGIRHAQRGELGLCAYSGPETFG